MCDKVLCRINDREIRRFELFVVAVVLVIFISLLIWIKHGFEGLDDYNAIEQRDTSHADQMLAYV